MSKKKGLKVKEVTKDHFSSGFDLNEPKFSRLVVRMIEGKHLLASDIETGKSDPVCFLWLGPSNESPVPPSSSSPDFEGFGTEDTPLFETTQVCLTTVDPIWNQDIVFPVDAANIDTFMSQKLLVYIRDEDKYVNGDVTTYDELGMLDISMKDFVSTSKAMKSSVVRAAQWYDLKKSPGMRKVEGSVKMTITLIIVPEDVSVIQGQFGADATAVKGGGLGAMLRASVSSSSDNHTRASFNSNMRNSYQGLPKRAVSASPVRRPSSAASVDSSSVVSNNNDRRARSAAPVRPRPLPMTAPAQQTVQEEEYLDEDLDQEREDDQQQPQDKYNLDLEEGEEQEELIVLPKQFSNKNVLTNNNPATTPKASRYDDANNDHDDNDLENDLMHDLLDDGPGGGDEGVFEEFMDIGMKVGGRVVAATTQAVSNMDTSTLTKSAAQAAAFAGDVIAKSAASASDALVKSAGHISSSSAANTIAKSAADAASSATELISKGGQDLSKAMAAQGQALVKSAQEAGKELYKQAQAFDVGIPSGLKIAAKQHSQSAAQEAVKHAMTSNNNPVSLSASDVAGGAVALGAANAAKNVLNKKEEVDVKAILASADKKDAAAASTEKKESVPITEKKELSTGAAPAETKDAAVEKDAKKAVAADEKAALSITKGIPDALIGATSGKVVATAIIPDDSKVVVKDAPVVKAAAPPPVAEDRKPIAKDAAPFKDLAAVKTAALAPDSISAKIAKAEAPLPAAVAPAVTAAKPIPIPTAVVTAEENLSGDSTKLKQKSSPKHADDDEKHALDAPPIGDQALDAIDDENDEQEEVMPLSKKKSSKQQQQQEARQEPERQHPTPSPNNSDNQPAAGRGAAAARVLAELRKQREELQIGLAAITAATQQGLSSLNDRLTRLESAAGIINSNHMQMMAGDEGAMPSSDNEDEEQDDRGKKRNRNDDSKKTISNKANNNSKSDNEKSSNNNNIKKDNNSKYNSQDDKKQASNSKDNNRPSSSNNSNNRERSTSAGRSRSTSINNQNVTMPSRVRSDSNSEFREFRRRRILEQYTNSGSFDDRGGVSNNNSRGITNYNSATRFASNNNSNGGGMPDAQLVFRDGSGRVSSAQMSSPPQQSSSYQQQQQQREQQNSMFGAPPGPGDEALPSPTNNNSDTLNNSGSNLRLSSSQPLPPINNSSYQQQQAQQQQLYQQQQMSPSKVQLGLNRDFCEALDRGGLDDVAQLLENSAAKPETLAVSTRNRVYDAISTLLMQRRHVERCLVWITALMRQSSQQHMASSLWSELTPHTQRDLQAAVKRAAQEASKRGVLASLLSSQVDRLMA